VIAATRIGAGNSIEQVGGLQDAIRRQPQMKNGSVMTLPFAD
jgi:hypothetical protein